MKECIAMILAGGQGSRLGVLTKNIAKPAATFAGKYKIIDFTLSNCANSGIDTVGVLTQYRPLELNSYIGSGTTWDLDRRRGGVFLLPPYTKSEKGEWYKGTANAIYQNIGFVERFEPMYVIVLSGDHIYKMDYGNMLEYHKEKKAAATIAVIDVPIDEASRFGIMNTSYGGRITEFEEKPQCPKSTLASMGVYIFNWLTLKKYLIVDENSKNSKNDFGADIIPNMLKSGEKLYAYKFDGYWKDVGTIMSLWEANMDLLKMPPVLDLRTKDSRIYSRSSAMPPHFIHKGASVRHGLVGEGCEIYGRIENSVISPGVYIGQNTLIRDSVIMADVRIDSESEVNKAIVGTCAQIGSNVRIGTDGMGEHYSDMCSGGICVVASNIRIEDKALIEKNSMVETDITINGQISDFCRGGRQII